MRKRVRTTNRNAVSGGDVVIVTPGDTDYLAPAGTNTDDIDRTIIEFGPVDMGDETSSVPSDEIVFELTTPAGTDSVSDAAEYSANLTHDAGDDTGTLQDGFTLVFGEQPVGEDAASAVGSSVTTVQDYVDTATEVQNGTPDVEWVDETNAEGVDDAAVASITLESGVGLPQSADSDLEMSFSSGSNYDLIFIGSPTVSASDFSGFGNKVIFPDGSYAIATNSSPFSLTGVTEFTIDLKTGAKAPGGPDTDTEVYAALWTDSATSARQWALYYEATGTDDALRFAWFDSGGAFRFIESSASAFDNSTAHDVRVVLDSGTLELLIDGVVVDSTTSNLTFRAPTSASQFTVGGFITETTYGALAGVDELRFSDVSRGAGAYTPATSPFTTDANTVGLWHMDSLNEEGPVQGTRSGVVLRIRHRLDTTMALTSNVNATLVLSKADGSDPLTLLESIRAALSPVGDVNVRNDGALADEDFDVTSHVSGWSEAELANALLTAHMDGSAIVAGGDAVWEIDSASLRRGYTVTGIT